MYYDDLSVSNPILQKKTVFKNCFCFLVGGPSEDVHTPLPVHSSAASGRDAKDPGLATQSLQSPRR